MKKLKPIAKKVKKPVILAYLDEGASLQDVIEKARDSGITNFNLVRYNHTYVGCTCKHECYCDGCDGSYIDGRFEISSETQ